MTPALNALVADVRSFIGTAVRSDPGEVAFGRLACRAFAVQFDANADYRSLCRSRGIGAESVPDWRRIPAVPTSGFKDGDISCLAPGDRVRVFHSSGTTGQVPSRHAHSVESLALYDASTRPWFRAHLDPSVDPGIRWVSLTPPSQAAPHSSLVHMFDTVTRDAPGGVEGRIFTGEISPDGDWGVDWETLDAALARAVASGSAVGLLGTAFHFVHLIDRATARGVRWRLPAGSRVLETGGYKGRSRELAREELHAGIESVLGIPPSHRVTEYGMAELGSQAYDHVAGRVRSGDSVLRFPPWARALVVSAETGREVPDGDAGLLRVVDLANAASAVAVQTADRAVRRGSGFILIGRAGQAEPRGCSLMSAGAGGNG